MFSRIDKTHYPIIIALSVLILGFLLSIPRYAFGDETFYLAETAIIYDCIRNFEWFGNQPVGLHGFLFKLPVALAFLVTEPSIFVATAFNVILSAVSAVLCYKLFLKIFHSEHWSAAGTLLTVSSYYFILTIPTFLRDIPGLFALLLLFISVFAVRKKSLLQGFLLLLLLDAKEYLFFMSVPPLLAYYALPLLRKKDVFLPRTWLSIIKNYSLLLLPSLIFIYLMLWTSLVPLNNFVGYILGFTTRGLTYTFRDFSIATATENFHGKGKKIVTFKDNKRFQKVSSGDGEGASEKLVDISAVKAIEAGAKAAEEGDTLLILDTKIKPEFSDVCKKNRMLTYFYSEFPERTFRNASINEGVSIMDGIGIGVVVLDPDFESNKYYLASKLPDILCNKELFTKLYEDSDIGFKVYKRADIFKPAFELASKNTEEGEKILLIDKSTDAIACDLENIVSFFSDSFPKDKFPEGMTPQKVFFALDEMGVGAIILNSQLDGNNDYEKSPIASLPKSPSLAKPLAKIGKYNVYKLHCVPAEMVEFVKNEAVPSEAINILVIGENADELKKMTQFSGEIVSIFAPSLSGATRQRGDLESDLRNLVGLGVNYMIIDPMYDGQPAFKNSLFFNLMTNKEVCEIKMKMNEFRLFKFKDFSHLIDPSTAEKKSKEDKFKNAIASVSGKLEKDERVLLSSSFVPESIPKEKSAIILEKDEQILAEIGKCSEYLFEELLDESRIRAILVSDDEESEVRKSLVELISGSERIKEIYSDNVYRVFYVLPKDLDDIYMLTVCLGTGSGYYRKGDKIDIAADDPPESMVFDAWVSEPQHLVKNIMSPKSEKTTVTIPEESLVLAPTYKQKPQLFRLNVKGGAGSGKYEAGAVVSLVAFIPDDMVFESWKIPEPSKSNLKPFDSHKAKLSMPGEDIEIEAILKPSPKLFKITVNGGTGSGEFQVGSNVQINAEETDDKLAFSSWKVEPAANSACISNLKDKTATFTVPHSNTVLTSIQSRASLPLYVWRKICRSSKIIAAYYGKICYPRTFSFLSVPLLVVVPSIAFALFALRRAFREDSPLVFLIFFLIFYLSIYVFRASHGRYLMHLSPIIFTFLLLFVRDAVCGKGLALKLAIFSSLPFVIGNICLEDSYSLVKIFANLLFVSILFLMSLDSKNERMISAKKKLVFVFVFAFSLFSFSTAIASSFKIGQIGKYIDYGYNCQSRIIASEFPKAEKIWINSNTNIFAFYRADRGIEARYPLDPRFPKSALLKKNKPLDYFFIRQIRYLEDSAYQKGIRFMGLLVADPKMTNKFPKQNEYLADFKAVRWLDFKKEVKLKNKTLYVFEVVGRKDSAE